MEDLIFRVAALEKRIGSEKEVGIEIRELQKAVNTHRGKIKALEQKLGTEDDMDAWYDSNMLDKPEEKEPPLATSGFIFVDLHKKILKKQREEFLADLEKLPIEYVRWVGKHTIAAINDKTAFGEIQSAMIFLPEITKLIEKWGRLKE